MADIGDDIAQLRQDVNDRAADVARAEHRAAAAAGQQEAILADLKAEFGCDSIEAAEAKAARYEKALRAAHDKTRARLAQTGEPNG
jgi:argininosuccinate synthase